MAQPKRRCYVDTNIWITAIQASGPESMRALEVIEDPERELLISAYVRLEVLPKPRFHNRQDQVENFTVMFSQAEDLPLYQSAIVNNAIDIAATHDLTPIDALHISTAMHGHAQEFVTLEKPTKPMFRVTEMTMVSIYQQSGV